MGIIPQMEMKVLDDAATRAHDAVSVSYQLQAMLQEYTDLEAQHAARLRALAQRMGDCVDRMRPPPTDHDNDEEELRVRQSQCVAVMDQVVTFLARFASMHGHLSDCLASDLFPEWNEALTVQEKRMKTQEPELEEAQTDMQAAEEAYVQAHATFQTDFDHACSLYANAATAHGADVELIEQTVQDEFAYLSLSEVALPRTRSPSKAMQYVGSISRLLRPSTDTTGDARRECRHVAASIIRAECGRRHCHQAYQVMHRLHVRYKRLCESLHQEYRCVQSECLASTRTSIRKLVIHVSAFTSNLQYDATQLFQQVEALHANDVHVPPSHTAFVVPGLTGFPSPPSDLPLSLEHVIRRRFPVMNERPRLLRHQNACHILAV